MKLSAHKPGRESSFVVYYEPAFATMALIVARHHEPLAHHHARKCAILPAEWLVQMSNEQMRRMCRVERTKRASPSTWEARVKLLCIELLL